MLFPGAVPSIASPFESDLSSFRIASLSRRCGTVAARRFPTRPRALLLSVALAATMGCGDDDGIVGIATTLNTARTVSVFALSGTPPALPAGYYFVTESLVRPQLLSSGGVNFEMAFDLNSDGRVSLIPAKVIVPEAPIAAPSIGIQQSSVPFEQLARAPDRGYVYDSTFTGQVGDTFVLQLLVSGCTFGSPLFAKVSIDSIHVAERRIVFSSMVNRNCGFRGLTAGLPTN